MIKKTFIQVAKENNQLLVGLLIVLCIFLSFYIKPFIYIALLSSAISLSFFSVRNSFCLMLLLLPFAQIFKPTAEGTSYFTILQFLLFFKCFVKHPFFSSNYIFFVLCFPLYVFVCSLVGDNFDLFKIIKLFVGLSIVYFFVKFYIESELEFYTTCFCAGLSLSILIGMFKEVIPGLLVYYSDLNMQYIQGIQVLRFSATFRDPNYFSIAVICCLGLILCTVYSKGFKIRLLVFSVLLIAAGVQTYSKSFVLMLLFLIAVSLRLLMGKNDLRKLFTVICVMCAVFLCAAHFLRDSIQMIIRRFDVASNLETLTSGRNSIWDVYLSHIADNPRVFVLGEGIDAPYILGAAHNMYIEIFYYVGLLGFIFYVFSLFGIFNARKIHRHKLINYYMLLIVAIMYLFLNGFTAFELPFYFIISWIVLNEDFSKKEPRLC